MRFTNANNPAEELDAYGIDKIVIYGRGEKLFETSPSRLQEYRTRNGLYESVYDGVPEKIFLSTFPKRANKENLRRTDNYMLRGTKSLYIHESEISVTDDGEKLATQSEHDKNYLHAVTLHFANGALMRRINVETIPDAGPHWTPPSGGTWGSGYGPDEDHARYDASRGAVYKRWLTSETVHNLPTSYAYYCRHEEDDARRNSIKLAEDFNRILHCDGRITYYGIERLLEVYDIKARV